jgi:hypothetical protein
MVSSGLAIVRNNLRSAGVFREAVLSILACIAKQERIRLSERVVAGLKRAKAQGKVLGRPKAAVRDERVLLLKGRGLSPRNIAEETGRQRDDGASHPGFPSVEFYWEGQCTITPFNRPILRRRGFLKLWFSLR